MNLHGAHTLVLLTLLLIGLSLNISRLRLRYQVSYGDGGHKDLLLAVPAHGNTLGQTLLFGVLLLAIEARHGEGGMIIAFLGMTFIVVRVLHSLATLRRLLLLRQVAHGTTLALQLAAVVALWS